MYKAIGICGSPRQNSNTEYYLKVALDTLAGEGVETELVLLADKTINACKADYACWQAKKNECEQRGDDFHEIYHRFIAADAVILGTPTHFAAPYPKLWSFLTRAGFPNMAGFYEPDFKPGPLSRKIGAPLAVDRRTGASNAFSQLLMWLYINDFIIPGNIYWNIGRARAIGDAASDTEGLNEIRHLAHNIAWTLRKIKP